MSGACGTFSRKDHILGHKIHFNTFKKTKTIQNMFSDHNGMRWEISVKVLKENTEEKKRKKENTEETFMTLGLAMILA